MHSIKSSGRRPCLPSDISADVPATAREPAADAATIPAKPSRLWLWFVAAFVIQAAAWTVWFTIAAQHRIEEVPLVSSGRR